MTRKPKQTANTDLTGGAPVKPMSPEEIMVTLGVPCTQRGQPDLQNHKPNRFISLEEAKLRGLAWFFPGDACRRGHIAAKRTVNPAICSDCKRVERGEEPIYGTSKVQTFHDDKRVAKAKAVQHPGSVVPGLLPPAPLPGESELTKAQQKFLECFVADPSLDAAAKAAGVSVAWVETQRAGSARFEEACNGLKVPHHVPKVSAFKWSDESRELLRRTYVNSGYLQPAFDAVHCTADDYYSELDTNADFRETIERAKPLANQTMFDVLVRSAAGGQQQSLAKWLELQQQEAERAMGRELTPAQLNAELSQALERIAAVGALVHGTCAECDAQLRHGDSFQLTCSAHAEQTPTASTTNFVVADDSTNSDLTGE